MSERNLKATKLKYDVITNVIESVLTVIINDVKAYRKEFSEYLDERLNELKFYELLDEVKNRYDLKDILFEEKTGYSRAEEYMSLFSYDDGTKQTYIDTTVGKLLFSSVIAYANRCPDFSNFDFELDANASKLLLDDAKTWAKVLTDAGIFDEEIKFIKETDLL